MDDSTTRDQEGIGMGLAISSGLTRLFNGGLSVESTYGSGSTFTATFQLELVDADTRSTTNQLVGCSLNVLILLDKLEDRAKSMKQHLDALGANGIIHLVDGHSKKQPLTSPSYNGLMPEALDLSAVIVSDTSNHKRYVEEIRHFVKSAKIPVFETRPFTSQTQKEEQGVLQLSVPINRAILFRTLQRHARMPDIAPPISLKRETLDQQPISESPENEQKNPLMAEMKVLTVDDNKINLKVAQGFLERESQGTDTAFDGVDALAKVKETQYDLIFMDIQMPRMDGVDCTKAIRKLYEVEFPDQRKPQIVALTANAIVGNRERYLACGMDDYLSKPLDKLSLRKVLRAARKSFAAKDKQ